MYRNRQMRARRLNRQVVGSSKTGLFNFIQLYNNAQLIVLVLALSFSVLLLFFGTYVYFDTDLPVRADDGTTSITRNPWYDQMLRIFGINEKDFAMLYHANSKPGSNYQIGLSMMFVGAVSIFVEILLVCTVLLEHFKLSLLGNFLLITSFVYRVVAKHGLVENVASFFVQAMLVFGFIFFTCIIKVKWCKVNKILKKNDIEL